jgi:hypothetical protein
MYDVSLINLAADARSAADSLAAIERPGLTDLELKTLFLAFCEIDPVENAVAAPEIRVKVRHESYLIRTGQKKLMLYDVLQRDLPGHLLTVDEVMAELDGSAPAARRASVLPEPEAAFGESATQTARVSPVGAASKPRLAVMGAVAAALLGALIYLQLEKPPVAGTALVRPLEPAESAELWTSLAGVFLTGNQPGQHGIVITAAGELKLIELGALAAPRVVLASVEPGRAGPRLALATDQPGGLIEVTDRDTLVYCGEIYRRVP